MAAVGLVMIVRHDAAWHDVGESTHIDRLKQHRIRFARVQEAESDVRGRRSQPLHQEEERGGVGAEWEGAHRHMLPWVVVKLVPVVAAVGCHFKFRVLDWILNCWVSKFVELIDQLIAYRQN
uniref:Uncharacterized protein n=1 Tax=Opuntia streptacantha TaxID=393608 RepID=A0A7C9ECP9_OPUST